MGQVANQAIQWLHEEALVVGMKTSRDLLCLHMNLEQGDNISLLAHVDPDDASACISWELALLPAATDDAVKFSLNQSDSENPRLKYLGSLSLESLYSVLMDLANFCGNSTICWNLFLLFCISAFSITKTVFFELVISSWFFINFCSCTLMVVGDQNNVCFSL